MNKFRNRWKRCFYWMEYYGQPSSMRWLFANEYYRLLLDEKTEKG